MTKIAFIICYNNELLLQECISYISFLKVPGGVETDIIGIAEAESLAAGYNAAMKSSDAKYKVYLHQDVFLLNKDFIEEVIALFHNNPEYGMLGILGSNRQIPDGNYWDGWNVGEALVCGVTKTGITTRQYAEGFAGGILPVVAIDGMLMITQCDVEWREDIFDGFDFYDVSQSIEFQKMGKKVGVLEQKKIWCLHDCGHTKLDKYDHYRKKFCTEYSEEGYKFERRQQQEQEVLKKKSTDQEVLKIEEMIDNGEIETAYERIKERMEEYYFHTKLCELFLCCQIILEERSENCVGTLYTAGMKAEELLQKFAQYKFALRRVAFGLPVDGMEEVIKEIVGGQKKNMVAIRTINLASVGGVKLG